MDAWTSLAYRPLLVDSRRLFLWSVLLVCRAGSSDEVSGRDWRRAERGRLGIGSVKLGGNSWSDRVRPFVGPDRTRMGMDDRQWGVCHLLRSLGPAPRCSDCATTVRDGSRPRNARL